MECDRRPRGTRDDNPAERQAARPLPDATAAGRELGDVLDRELAALPDRYRAALVLCVLEGLPLREAAQRLGCPPGTVVWAEEQWDLEPWYTERWFW